MAVVFYHNDLDGRAAGAVVNQYYKARFPGATTRFIEINYDRATKILKKIPILPGETVIVVDFGFKPEDFDRILSITENVIWIDHHISSFSEEYEKYHKLDGLRSEEKIAGCELTWKHFYPDVKMPRSLELIGDRDAWRWQYGISTAAFNAGLKLYDHQPLDDIWKRILSCDSLEEAKVNDIIQEGKLCLKYRDMFFKNYIHNYGFEVEFEGRICFAVGLYKIGSDGFGDEMMNKYDICIAFEYTGESYIVGLYSYKLDVAEIAKKWGGGGHKSASGFTCCELPFVSMRNVR